MIKTTSETKNVEQALTDLIEICTKHNIDYRVYGSTAYVCAADNLYRIPGDVDVLFDRKKEKILHNEFLKKGYTLAEHAHKLDRILPRKLLRYKKGGKVVEPTGADFSNETFCEQLFMPIPFVPKDMQPKVYLLAGKKTFMPVVYQFGNIRFKSLSKEAFKLGLGLFIDLIKEINDKTDKRLKDYSQLAMNLNKDLVEEITHENPGIYFGPIPLVTIKTSWFMKVALMFLRSSKN